MCRDVIKKAFRGPVCINGNDTYLEGDFLEIHRHFIVVSCEYHTTHVVPPC